MKMLFNVIFMLFFLIACQSTKPVINTASQALEKVITDYQHFKEHQSPLNQDKAGDTNRLLPDLSPESLKKQHLALSAIYQKLEQIKTEKLNSDESINHAVLAYTIKNQLDNYINNEHYMPLTAESGFHVWISRINRQVSFNTEQDYRDYLARITALPSYFSQQMYWMDKGIEAGITQPKIVLQGFEESIKAFIKTDATTSTYYQPFETMPEHFTAELKAELQSTSEKHHFKYGHAKLSKIL